MSNFTLDSTYSLYLLVDFSSLLAFSGCWIIIFSPLSGDPEMICYVAIKALSYLKLQTVTKSSEWQTTKQRNCTGNNKLSNKTNSTEYCSVLSCSHSFYFFSAFSLSYFCPSVYIPPNSIPTLFLMLKKLDSSHGSRA